MQIINTVWRSILSIIILFVLTKLIGARQVSNMSLFDYINGITIGSIAAELAVNPDGNPIYPLVAMIIYGLVVYAVHITECKIPSWRHFLVGKSLILYDNGRFNRKNFKKGSFSTSEFLELLRNQGLFDMKKIKRVMLEPNGKLSVEFIEKNRPTELGDLGSHPSDPPSSVPVILDGQTNNAGLRSIGRDANWLSAKLSGVGLKCCEVFIAFGDCDDSFYAYPYDM